jgi:hypothetical protein
MRRIRHRISGPCGIVVKNTATHYPYPRLSTKYRPPSRAKRMVDMLYVSSLDRETADRHFRRRPAAAPGRKAMAAIRKLNHGSW